MIILGNLELYLLSAGGARHYLIHTKITSREGLVAEFAPAAAGLAGIFGRLELRRSLGKGWVRHGRKIPQKSLNQKRSNSSVCCPLRGARFKPDEQASAGSPRQALESPHRGVRPPAFQPGKDRLGCPHFPGQFSLRKADTVPGIDHGFG